ncbi:hypothetical protein, partial [Acetobacter malorum]|uniref:hypothetical protein n=1 Tax=Acetobacter malorum TaxID=178901 RepID=UPI001C4EAB31
ASDTEHKIFPQWGRTMEQRQPLPLIQLKNRAISGVCGANCGTRTLTDPQGQLCNTLKRQRIMTRGLLVEFSAFNSG